MVEDVDDDKQKTLDVLAASRNASVFGTVDSNLSPSKASSKDKGFLPDINSGRQSMLS